MTRHPASRKGPLAGQSLTSAALIHIDYLPPPEVLAPFITTFFLLRCDESHIADVQPASVGILAIFLRGQGAMHFRDGTVDHSHRVNLMTPLATAAPIVVEGPWHTFGAALSPLGWAALTGGLSAAEYGNHLREAGELLDPSVRVLGDALIAGYERGELSAQAMVDLASRVLRRLLNPVPKEHVALIAQVAEWLGQSLSPRVDDLARRALYSPRQLQRLVDRYFGLPPKQLARKYRALRAATLLSDPNLPPDELAVVFDQFYDQSHMAREIRLFAGRTPARLGDAEQPILSELLRPYNFREIAPPDQSRLARR